MVVVDLYAVLNFFFHLTDLGVDAELEMKLCTIILQDHELVVEVQTSADASGANVLTLDWYVLFGIDVEHI
jgi:hypothetical protein